MCIRDRGGRVQALAAASESDCGVEGEVCQHLQVGGLHGEHIKQTEPLLTARGRHRWGLEELRGASCMQEMTSA